MGRRELRDAAAAVDLVLPSLGGRFRARIVTGPANAANLPSISLNSESGPCRIPVRRYGADALGEPPPCIPTKSSARLLA